MFLWLSLSKEANPPFGELAHSLGSGYLLKSCSSAALFSVSPDNANIEIYKLTQFKLHSLNFYRMAALRGSGLLILNLNRRQNVEFTKNV